MAKIKPNFFLGFQVYDKGIHQNVKLLQKKIIEKTPSLEPALINISSLHVTLAVTHLANETDINTLKNKLEDWKNKELKSFFQNPVVLNFTGVNTFNNTVVYVKMDQHQKLSDISQAINELILSAGFSTDKKGFTPHLTILKLTKDYKLLRSRKNFKEDFETLRQCTEHFGTQELSHIQLLSMESPKDENGYYKCYHQISITDSDEEKNNSGSTSPALKIRKMSPEPST